MKKPIPFRGTPVPFYRLGNSRGIALISVLAVLILLTVLVVAFLMRASVARTSSANYRATTGSRLLNDTVLNLVQAEINDATSYGTSASASGSGPFTWASQPGAIRVFDSTGSLKKIYRLYSAPALTASSASEVLDSNGNSIDISTTWANSPSLWVDLNAPVAATGLTNTGTSTSVSIYPILDNRSPQDITKCVQMPGFYVNILGTSTFPTAATTTLNPPVMPVQWLYVLQDGTMIAPTGGNPSSSSGGATATFTAPNAPTAANPIVGRVAYWTDDDTCKVNINTAAGSVSYRTDANGNGTLVGDGGVFYNPSTSASTTALPQPNAWAPAPWDVPRYGGSWDDVKLLAENQPVASEYQRYPGHPATTILYYALRALGVSSAAGFGMPEVLNLPRNGFNPYSLAFTTGSPDTQSGGLSAWPHTSSLFGLTPRYNDNGGSQGGLVDTTHSVSGTVTVTSITPNRSRLYTSLGELLYSPTSASGSRVENGILNGATTPTAPYFTRQQIETGKFFLTAHSRAPETTLFGTPRVAMWPIPDTTKTSTEGKTMTKTALDQLISFCSTTDTGNGGTPYQYYFKRYDRANATNDYNNEARNQVLFGYLQDLTGGSIPGYGGNFLSKYGVSNERDQILTEMIDYIRCENLNDHSNPGGVNFATDGEVIPLQITKAGKTTAGLGRLITLSEIGLHVICTADGTNNLAGLNGSNANTGYSGAGNTGSSVIYNTPVITSVSTTIPVSPVIGSASDPAYVSNLPVAQFLRDTGNNIVDMFGTTVSSGNASSCQPFPANQTLTTTYGGVLTALPIGSKRLQAMLLFEPTSPMLGYDQMTASGGQGPDVNIQVTNIQNISVGGQNPFPNRTDSTNSAGPSVNGNGYMNGNGLTGLTSTGASPGGWVNNGDADQGGIFGFRFPLGVYAGSSGTNTNINKTLRVNGWSGVGALNPPAVNYSAGNEPTADTLGAFTALTAPLSGANSPSTMWKPYAPSGAVPYRFVSNPFTVTNGNFVIGGAGSFNVNLTMPVKTSTTTSQVSYQSYTVSLPAVTLTSPPTLPAYGFNFKVSGSYNSYCTTRAPDWWNFDNRIGWCNEGSSFYANIGSSVSATIGMGAVVRGDPAAPTGGWAGGTAWKWNDTGTFTPSLSAVSTTNTSYGDVVRSLIPKDGDYRLTMAKPTVNAALTSATSPLDFSAPPQYTNGSQLAANMFMEPGGSQGTTGSDVSGTLINNLGSIIPAPYIRPKVPSTFSTGTPDPRISIDWDTGRYGGSDGAYANKPDEGCDYVGNGVPYVNAASQTSNSLTSYYTANRIVNSPVMFGSLPTGVAENIPWRTLLFRPQLTTAQGGSRTAVMSPAGPKDYLMLDNFWMPVVQPYAISEPFSTAGKINMNYQILPFTHITRSTGVQAVLASELVARVPAADAATNPGYSPTAYYQGAYFTEGTKQSDVYGVVKNGSSLLPGRLPLNLSEVNGTLRQFREKFNGLNGKTQDIFHSPAEICDIYLVPKDSMNSGSYTNWTSDAAADAGWYSTDFGLVGDNVREKPYGDLYPRLTTKSNTYTVYYNVQVLKNPPGADQTKWSENTGVITGQYRGSTSLERYLDPNNNSIPDYTASGNNPAATPSAKSLDTFYQWRTVANNAFNP